MKGVPSMQSKFNKNSSTSYMNLRERKYIKSDWYNSLRMCMDMNTNSLTMCMNMKIHIQIVI